jgi:hypothetical protein
VYLADFRSSDPNKDYIIPDWRYVDLSVLGGVDSLVLILRSSDVGAFGMNTPAYVCIDRVSTDNLLAAYVADRDAEVISIQPNPVTETLYIELQQRQQVTIYDRNGTSIWGSTLDRGYHRVSVASWPPGIYVIALDGQAARRFVVE